MSTEFTNSQTAFPADTKPDVEFKLNEQGRTAWEQDSARIDEFFSNPLKYIKPFWQQYKPIIIALSIIAIALIALNMVLAVIGIFMSIPLVGVLLQLVGLGYLIWFAQKFLLTAQSRQELAQKIEQIKESIIGTTEEIVGDTSLAAKKSVTIQRSPQELYRFWRNFENLPRFMNHLESVTVLDNQRSHWVAKAPLGTTVEWDAEIIDEKENRSIVWKSLEGAQVDSIGSVAFTSANGSGTQVKVTMKYNPPAGVVGAAVAAITGENPQQQLDEDLERLKQVIEASAG